NIRSTSPSFVFSGIGLELFGVALSWSSNSLIHEQFAQVWIDWTHCTGTTVSNKQFALERSGLQRQSRRNVVAINEAQYIQWMQ
ncbi:MAG: hypothetical protein EZS28_049324, partial [Streblomastix strix]